ncbi:MAG: 50S ribosomal protein L14e [Candidatus Methanomethylicia archaeon]
MALLDLIGRVCIKTRGREKNRKCVIVDVVDDNFVIITGPKDLTGVRRRRVNIKHLSITEQKINISRGAPDSEVRRVLASLQEYSVKSKQNTA